MPLHTQHALAALHVHQHLSPMNRALLTPFIATTRLPLPPPAALCPSGHRVAERSSMEVVEAGCCFERAEKPRVAVRRWRGWGSSVDPPADRTQYVHMCRAPWVDCVCMGGALICMGRGRKEEERLERIKTFLMQKEILKRRPSFAVGGTPTRLLVGLSGMRGPRFLYRDRHL